MTEITVTRDKDYSAVHVVTYKIMHQISDNIVWRIGFKSRYMDDFDMKFEQQPHNEGWFLSILEHHTPCRNASHKTLEKLLNNVQFSIIFRIRWIMRNFNKRSLVQADMGECRVQTFRIVHQPLLPGLERWLDIFLPRFAIRFCCIRGIAPIRTNLNHSDISYSHVGIRCFIFFGTWNIWDRTSVQHILRYHIPLCTGYGSFFLIMHSDYVTSKGVSAAVDRPQPWRNWGLPCHSHRSTTGFRWAIWGMFWLFGVKFW